MKDIVRIDGAMGEGGGQVLRTSLALSLVTGVPCHISNIRSGRKKPGLLRQHLTAVKAAVEISGATVIGAEMGSRDIEFRPAKVSAGEYAFSVGTAGSTTLVLQTILPALMTGKDETRIILEGGTHNPYAPPFDFLEKAFLPLLGKIGPQVTCSLERPGYYPAGGGRFSVLIKPSGRLNRLDIRDRGELRGRMASGIVCQLSPEIARRELDVVRKMLNWGPETLEIRQVRGSNGPGNVLILELMYEHVHEVFTGFGERGIPAEAVAKKVCEEVRRYIASGAPVGRYLADQLLLPMSLAGGGSFRTVPLSRHTMTNIEVIRRFLDVDISCKKEEDETSLICVSQITNNRRHIQ